MPKQRKWSNLQVPEEPVELTEREVAIRKLADEYRGSEGVIWTMRALAVEYASAVEEEKFETLAAKERSVKYEALERVIREQLQMVEDLTGQDMWRGEGQVFSPKFTPIPVIHDRDSFMRWLEDEGVLMDYLKLDSDKVKDLVKECLDTDAAVTMTPAERAALKPGQPASGQLPPGVSVFMRRGINRTETRVKVRE